MFKLKAQKIHENEHNYGTLLKIRNRQATEKKESIVVSKIKSSFVSNTLKIVLKYSCWSIYLVYVNFIVIGNTDNYLEKKQR